MKVTFIGGSEESSCVCLEDVKPVCVVKHVPSESYYLFVGLEDEGYAEGMLFNLEGNALVRHDPFCNEFLVVESSLIVDCNSIARKKGAILTVGDR